MSIDPLLQKRLTFLGAAAGLTGCLMYAVRSAMSLPAVVSQLLFMFFGPVLVVAYVGSYPFMVRPRVSVAAILGAVFGVIGAAVNMMFSVVQLNNLHYIRGVHSRGADKRREGTVAPNLAGSVFRSKRPQLRCGFLL